MAKASDLLLGTLDMLILRTLTLGPLHGVGIADRIEQVTGGVFVVGPGSLFPALHRLAEKGWIEGDWGELENRRRAKFYALTPIGARPAHARETELAEGADRREPGARRGVVVVSWASRLRHLRRRVLDDDLDVELQSYSTSRIERRMARGAVTRRGAACRPARTGRDGPDEAARTGGARRRRARTTWRTCGRPGGRSTAAPASPYSPCSPIALGLRADAAVFSLVDGILLKSSGYPEPERIVQLWEKPPRGMRNGISGANYRRLGAAEPVLPWNRRDDRRPAELQRRAASRESLQCRDSLAAYFDVFGVKAALGRTFARGGISPATTRSSSLTHRVSLNLLGRRWSTRFAVRCN